MTIKNEEMSEKKQLTKKTKIIISIVSIVIVLAIIISSCFIWQNSQAIKLIANTNLLTVMFQTKSEDNTRQSENTNLQSKRIKKVKK